MHAIFFYFFGPFFDILKPFLTENEKTEAKFQISIDESHLFHFIHFFPFQSGRPSKWPKCVKNFQKSTFFAKILDIGLKLRKFFFFKQKTAYEILSGLVGSEMCIRDRCTCLRARTAREIVHPIFAYFLGHFFDIFNPFLTENEKTEATLQIGIDAVSYTHLTLPTICSV